MVRPALLAVALLVAPAATLAQSTRMIIPPLPPPDRPTYRVEVTAPAGIETALDAVRRALAADPLPGRSAIPQPAIPRAARVDVLPVMTGLVRRVQKARRARAEQRIHAEVAAELTAFCEVNDCAAPNEGLLLPRSW